MRLNTTLLISLSCLATISNAVPFRIQDAELQRHRRRAVDYPIDSTSSSQPERKLHKRAAPYSVVQVDGSPSTNAPAPPAATITITKPGSTPAPATETVLITSTIAGPTSDETVVITTTRELANTVTAMASPSVITVAASPNAEPSLSTVVSITTETAGADFTADMTAQTQTLQVTNTVENTVVNTVTQTATTSSPAACYDNGQWHTNYPIGTFVCPPAATPVNDAAAAGYASSSGTESSLVNDANKARRFKRADNAAAYPFPERSWTTPTPVAHAPRDSYPHRARRSEAAYAPIWPSPSPKAQSHAMVGSSLARRNEAAYAPAWPSPSPKAQSYATTGSSLARRGEEPYLPYPAGSRSTSRNVPDHAFSWKEARKAPADLKLASYDINQKETDSNPQPKP